MIKCIMFDFGGVLAEEGFREGLLAIAREWGIDPDFFFRIAEDSVYSTGYLTGNADEQSFWDDLRGRTALKGSNDDLRDQILKRFILRPHMLGFAEQVRSSGRLTAILSDQTNWLDEINAAHPFFHRFDHVFNSYHIHKSKRDPSVFTDACSAIGVAPGHALFVDDNMNHIARASQMGLRTHHFVTEDSFFEDMRISGILSHE